MKIILAPDSFKECLSAVEVCAALEAGIRRIMPDAEIVSLPMADGGEGTLDAVQNAIGGELVPLTVRGPLAEPVEAHYLLVENGKTAFIESAQAVGLHLIPENMRRPAETTSFGLGQLMKHAILKAVSRIVVGLGGSGTNDAGAGMGQALGFNLVDAQDRELPLGGLPLERLHFIDSHKSFEGLRRVEVVAACDVDNPLCGPTGASLVYGPQKGASPEMAERLDRALRHFGEIAESDLGHSVLEVAGAGAAGGLAGGLIAFADATLRPGFEIIAELYGLHDQIVGADHVLTGEGSLDAQSLHGKTPIGVARMAKRATVPCTAFVGILGQGWEQTLAEGFEAAIPISPDNDDDARVPEEARQRLTEAAATWAMGITTT